MHMFHLLYIILTYLEDILSIFEYYMCPLQYTLCLLKHAFGGMKTCGQGFFSNMMQNCYCSVD